MKSFGTLIVELYQLGNSVKDDDISFKVKMLANALAKLGNQYQVSEKNPENSKSSGGAGKIKY